MILAKLFLAAFLVTFNFYAARSLGKAETIGPAALRFLLLVGALLAVRFVLGHTPLASYGVLAVLSFGLLLLVLFATSATFTPSFAALPPRFAQQARRGHALFVLVGMPSPVSLAQLLPLLRH